MYKPECLITPGSEHLMVESSIPSSQGWVVLLKLMLKEIKKKL
jgi:hypothetical protein